MIYYGTEAGMWGADDPDDRKPMVWKEFDYEPEAHHPLNKNRPVDRNDFDERLFRWYRKLGQIRNRHLALQTGEIQQLMVDNSRNVWAFARILNERMFTITIVNRSEQSQKIQLPLQSFEIQPDKHLENLITDSRIQVNNQQAEVILPPVSGAILAPEKD
jgi:glycosidase